MMATFILLNRVVKVKEANIDEVSFPAFIETQIRIQTIYISPGHAYWPPRGVPRVTDEVVSVDEVKAVAGRGLVGDRYFHRRPNHNGQVTLIDGDVIDKLRAAFGRQDLYPGLLRRNIVVRGVILSELLKKSFRVGDSVCYGVVECLPCHWMDRAIGDGAKDFLAKDFGGGLRCKILQSGRISVDPVHPAEITV